MPARSPAPTLALGGALALYALMLPFPFLASALLAPAAGVAFLVIGWAAGGAAAVALARRRSWWTLALPPAALAFWAAVVTIGDLALGWTA